MNEKASAEPAAEVPALIINGFLGSGKTTLLTGLLVQCVRRRLAVGVVVNDMSELDVDGLLVAQRELFEKDACNFQVDLFLCSEQHPGYQEAPSYA